MWNQFRGVPHWCVCCIFLTTSKRLAQKSLLIWWDLWAVQVSGNCGAGWATRDHQLQSHTSVHAASSGNVLRLGADLHHNKKILDLTLSASEKLGSLQSKFHICLELCSMLLLQRTLANCYSLVMHSNLFLKIKARDVALWWSNFLASGSSWIQQPASQKAWSEIS